MIDPIDTEAAEKPESRPVSQKMNENAYFIFDKEICSKYWEELNKLNPEEQVKIRLTSQNNTIFYNKIVMDFLKEKGVITTLRKLVREKKEEINSSRI